ncbi:MAG: arginine repressor [Candidatus Latescibacterota bacterium]
MRTKEARQARIRQVLEQESVGTHEQLAEALRRWGIEASQPTLSKDLRELGVVRVPTPEGGARYELPGAGTTLRDRRILERELRDFLVSVDLAANLLVVHTAPGHAQSVCEAIDSMDWEEAVGTIAGENTIFVAARSPAEAQALRHRIAELVGDAMAGVREGR